MNEATNKVRFSDKHPVMGLLLTTYVCMFLAQFVFGSVTSFALYASVGFGQTEGVGLGATLGSLVVLAIYYKMNSPEYRFIPAKGSAVGSLQLISPIVCYWVIIFGLYAVIAGTHTFAALSAADVFACLMAGFSEEIIFREITVSYMTRHWNREKMIPFIVLASGLMFGITHMGNLFSGGKLTDILYQVLLSTLFGCFFGAVYMRKGNVWVLAPVHMLHDMLSFSNAYGLKNAGVDSLPNWLAVIIAVVEFGLCVYGFYLVRPARREEITDLWDRKWSRPVSQS